MSMHKNMCDPNNSFWFGFLLYVTFNSYCHVRMVKIVSGYDQEIPQSQTADNPVAPRGLKIVSEYDQEIPQSQTAD